MAGVCVCVSGAATVTCPPPIASAQGIWLPSPLRYVTDKSCLQHPERRYFPCWGHVSQHCGPEWEMDSAPAAPANGKARQSEGETGMEKNWAGGGKAWTWLSGGTTARSSPPVLGWVARHRAAWVSAGKIASGDSSSPIAVPILLLLLLRNLGCKKCFWASCLLYVMQECCKCWEFWRKLKCAPQPMKTHVCIRSQFKTANVSPMNGRNSLQFS